MNYPKEVTLTLENVINWPDYAQLLADEKVIADSTGRLRYPHGAPVGKMILVRVNKNGTPVYRESADEWFDPESPRAISFQWPD